MKPMRVCLLGCGVVGGGVVRLLRANASALEARVGAPLEIARVLVRDASRERVPELDAACVTTDPEVALSDETVDVVIELMGGEQPAKQYVERAIDQSKQVVTANKMLLALHGADLVERAQKRGVDIAFEGAVGGGIPVIRVLREALASDTIDSLTGIVNGTSNFVLTRMQQDGATFAEAVRDAQERGFAEADPTLDVGGFDAAHKLVVLAMLAFGARVPQDAVPTEGIESLEPIDHAFAERFGYVIKHLASGKRTSDGRLALYAHSALVPRSSPLANISGVLNAVALEGRALGPCLLSGRGAGELPTAVSVVADLVDVAIARRSGVPGLMTRAISASPVRVAPLADVVLRHYLRFSVKDRPGVLAKIAGALGEEGVSIEQLVQQGRGGAADAPVEVVMLTHEAADGAVGRALARIAKEEFIARPPQRLRVH
jgi:homoserine dehydrogenase